MATHSSILAWRVPMDRRGWQAIQSIGSHRVRHDQQLRNACKHSNIWMRQLGSWCYPSDEHLGAGADCVMRKRCLCLDMLMLLCSRSSKWGGAVGDTNPKIRFSVTNQQAAIPNSGRNLSFQVHKLLNFSPSFVFAFDNLAF